LLDWASAFGLEGLEVKELLRGRQRAPIEEAAKRWRRAGVPIAVLTSRAFGKCGKR
jgi:hypothetical protein